MLQWHHIKILKWMKFTHTHALNLHSVVRQIYLYIFFKSSGSCVFIEVSMGTLKKIDFGTLKKIDSEF